MHVDRLRPFPCRFTLRSPSADHEVLLSLTEDGIHRGGAFRGPGSILGNARLASFSHLARRPQGGTTPAPPVAQLARTGASLCGSLHPRRSRSSTTAHPSQAWGGW